MDVKPCVPYDATALGGMSHMLVDFDLCRSVIINMVAG
jgi:hypothetical protein